MLKKTLIVLAAALAITGCTSEPETNKARPADAVPAATQPPTTGPSPAATAAPVAPTAPTSPTQSTPSPSPASSTKPGAKGGDK